MENGVFYDAENNRLTVNHGGYSVTYSENNLEVVDMSLNSYFGKLIKEIAKHNFTVVKKSVKGAISKIRNFKIRKKSRPKMITNIA